MPLEELSSAQVAATTNDLDATISYECKAVQFVEADLLLETSYGMAKTLEIAEKPYGMEKLPY